MVEFTLIRSNIRTKNHYLCEDGEVDGDLEGAADEELRRSVAQVEVGRLEGVAAHPHQHHLNAAKWKGMSR